MRSRMQEARLLTVVLTVCLLSIVRVESACGDDLLFNETGWAIFGNHSYLGRCSVDPNVGLGEFTIEVWVHISADAFSTSNPHGLTFFSYGQGTDQKALMLWLSVQSATPKLHISTGNQGSSSDDDAWNLDDGEWHHIAVTRTPKNPPKKMGS